MLFEPPLTAGRSELALSTDEEEELRIGFADGGSWEFEVPKSHRKTAERLVRALQA